MISAREAKHLDVTTLFTYLHANTSLGQSERAYYLSYFINTHIHLIIIYNHIHLIGTLYTPIFTLDTPIITQRYSHIHLIYTHIHLLYHP